MIKADIVKAIVEKYGLTVRQATAILQTCLDEIVSGLVDGEAVELRRFGVFKTKKQKARTIIHPKTGKPIQRPSQTIVLFETSTTVKAVLNKPKRKTKPLRRAKKASRPPRPSSARPSAAVNLNRKKRPGQASKRR